MVMATCTVAHKKGDYGVPLFKDTPNSATSLVECYDCISGNQARGPSLFFVL